MVAPVQLPRIHEIARAAGGVDALMRSLSPSEQRLALDSWDLWRLPYQDLPGGAWRRWLLQAGRGTGKTHTGARWVSELARDKARIGRGEIGLVARTYSDARHTMVEGPSGVLAVTPDSWRPEWSPATATLTWPNGVRGRIYTADEPDGLRGKNFSLVWADEVCFWTDAENVWWTQVEPALRTGRAQAILTTTPTRSPFLGKLIAAPGTVVTRAGTLQNSYLAHDVRAALRDRYAGTRIGRQELDGEILTDNPGALWRSEWLEKHRVRHAPELARIVVGVDPAVSYGEDSDETGIVVVGKGRDERLYVLADRTMKGSPHEWACAVRRVFDEHEADSVVCEVNQGGDMVEATLRAELPHAAIEQVRATRGKRVRAEPVASMYERGSVSHVGVLDRLESQLTEWNPDRNASSPDRLDALVWACTQLISGPAPRTWEMYL